MKMINILTHCPESLLSMIKINVLISYPESLLSMIRINVQPIKSLKHMFVQHMFNTTYVDIMGN